MGIQLDSTGINDIYIGNTNIKKVLLGNIIVYQKQEVVTNDYVKDSLFAYYDLTQFKLTDTSVTDLTGNGHNMEVSNVGSAIKDNKGGLNTKNSSIVIANYNMGFTPTNATLEWFGMPNQVDSVVFENRCCGATGNNGTGYFAWIASNVNSKQARLVVFKNNTKLCEQFVTANIPSNTPSHFAITFGDTEFKTYINGELVHTGSCNSNAGTNAVYLLATSVLASSAVNYSINHTLYSARLYSRELSASEVSQNRQYEINKYNGN